MKTRKLMAAALAIGLVAATAVTASAGEKVQINMWAGMTGDDANVVAAMLDEFMEENPDIEVAWQSVTWSEIFAKWQQAFDTDLGPDVMLMHATDITTYASKDMLTPLDDMVEALGVNKDDYSEAIWTGSQYDGVQYGIPMDFHCMGIFKNADLFEAAGLDPNMTFESEEDFLDACEKLNDPDNGVYAIAIGSSHAHTYRYWYGLLHQFGGTFVNDDLTEGTFASDAGVKALDWVAALPNKLQYAPFNEQDIDADFLSGKVAMVIDGPWFIPSAMAAGINFTTAPFMHIGDTDAVWANSHTITIPAESGRSEEDEAAARKLVTFIVEHSFEWGAKAGHIPANATVRESDEYKAADVYPYAQAFASQAAYVVYEPLCEGTSKFGADNELSPVMSAITNIVSGNSDDTAGELQTAQDAVTEILSEEF